MRDQNKTKAQLIAELDALRQELKAPSPEVAQAPAPNGEDRFRSVVDNIVDGIITIDAKGIISFFNPAAERIFGYNAAEVVGQSVSLLMPEPYHHQHDGYLASYLATGIRKIIGIGREVMGRRRDGSVFPMDLAVSEFRLGGERMFTGIVRDISQRKELEAQLLQAQKMESIGQLAGGIAHDFNNQLGIILFDLDLLIAETEGNNALVHDLDKIRKVVLRAAELTRKLLLFSRRQRMELRPLNLNQQVREMEKMLARLLGAEIQIHLRLAEDLFTVQADPSTLDQVLINLALNARDAMPGGGILYLETRNVPAAAQPSSHPGPFACLAVRDTGTGMDEEVRQRIFEPFFTTKDHGTGLGLAMVYGIVQSHRGWIAVDSSPGKGTGFEIFLPALQQTTPDQPLDQVAALKKRGQGERLLVVEDEVELSERLAQTLGDHNYAVQTASSIAEARRLWQQEGFDLVLSDVALPDGKGPELLFALREERPGLRALLITGHLGQALDWERLQQAGFPVLHKPFAVEALLSQVRELLGRRP
ncbi:MAG: PAS domain S-box protein [Candidatus Latescibacteria bacterium]|nr:PAS domain S-box protein [Candidatus Latescibacterota bacterium]